MRWEILSTMDDEIDRRLRDYARLTRQWMQSEEGSIDMAARARRARRTPDMSASAIDARLQEQAKVSMLALSLARARFE